MKATILILFIAFVNSLCAQFQEIYDYPELNIYDQVNDLHFKNENFGVFLVSQQNNGKAYIRYEVTQNGGSTWYSDTLKDFSVQGDCLNITESDIIYLSGMKRHYNVNNQVTPSFGVYKSTNKGQDWTYTPIDSQNGQIRHRNLVFLNDSVGMFAYGAGIYVTMDYAATWSKISDDFVSPIGKIGNTFTHRVGDTLFKYDPYSETWTYHLNAVNCPCGPYFLESNENFVVESFTSSDGDMFGYPYYNFPVLQISSDVPTVPTELHFMRSDMLIDANIFENRAILLGLSSLIVTDDWQNFYLHPFLNDTTGYHKISFINESVGYVISTSNLPSGNRDYKLWKTSQFNGNLGELVSNVNPTASLSDLDADEMNIYPNPTDGLLQVKIEISSPVVVKDMTGKIIMETMVNPGISPLDLRSFENGVYLVEIGSKTSKVIKRDL